MARCGERRRNMQECGFSISSSEAPLDSHILLLHSLPCPLPALQAYHDSCAAAASAGAGACAIAERFRLRRRGSASGPTARRARASAMLKNTNARWHAKGLTLPAVRAACGRQALVLLEHRPPHLAVAGKLTSNPVRIRRSIPTERRCPPRTQTGSRASARSSSSVAAAAIIDLPLPHDRWRRHRRCRLGRLRTASAQLGAPRTGSRELLRKRAYTKRLRKLSFSEMTGRKTTSWGWPTRRMVRRGSFAQVRPKESGCYHQNALISEQCATATRSSRNLPRVEFLPEETSQLSLAASTRRSSVVLLPRPFVVD